MLWSLSFLLFFFFLRFYLFIFREREREGERRGVKHQCVVASSAPPTGDRACNPGTCPDWGSNQRRFGLHYRFGCPHFFSVSNITTSAFFLLISVSMIYLFISFNIFESLYLNYVSYRQHMVRSFFFHSVVQSQPFIYLK